MNSSTVAIAGSGIVGTTIAYELTKRGYDVTIFEKGPSFPYPHGRQFQQQVFYLHDSPEYRLSTDIRQVVQTGDYHRDIDNERGMVVGGSATHWWGTTPRMIPSDFRTRTLYGYGDDWPLSYQDIEPYYCRAERHIGVSGTTADNSFSPPRSEPYPLPPFELSYGDRVLKERLNAEGLAMHTTPQARTRMSHDGRPPCQNFGVCHVCPIGARYSPNHHLQRALMTGHCTLQAETSVRRILIDASGQVRGLLVQPNDESNPYEHAADVIIIAAGAIESARLLLLSDHSMFPQGIGNHSGQVGQNLTFHHIWASGFGFETPLYTGRIGPATGRSFQFLDPPTRGKHGGVNIGMDDREDVRWLMGSYDLWNVRDPDQVVDRIESMVYKRGINFHSESIPDDQKYVALSSNTDRFGDPFPLVHYTSSDFDYATHEYVTRLFRRFQNALKPSYSWMNEDPLRFDSGAHHMGTCRMGTDPSNSVTDPFGKVHGTSNLFVGGGAIFVGGSGAVQPTLTMTALALRTADYISDQLLAE